MSTNQITDARIHIPRAQADVLRGGGRLMRAIDSEVSAYNRDRSGDAAFWKATASQEMAENRRLRALLTAAGIDPSPDVTAIVNAALK